MPTSTIETSLQKRFPEFAPLDATRAEELKRLINLASKSKQGVVIAPEGEGVTEVVPVDLISPNDRSNVLVRYRRHY